MEKGSKTIDGTTIEYFVHGTNPKWLFDSGTHGDEWQIIPLVRKAIEKNSDKLPAFIYIPIVSPSAVELKTRNNKNDIDVNRNYFQNSNVDEVLLMSQIIEPYFFDLSITWHEDDTKEGFYFYDTEDISGSKELATLRNHIKALGVPLYNGLDWEGDEKWANDSAMGARAIDGYIANSPAKDSEELGDFASWKFAREHIKRILNPEIPGKLSLGTKQKIVNYFVEDILLKLI